MLYACRYWYYDDDSRRVDQELRAECVQYLIEQGCDVGHLAEGVTRGLTTCVGQRS